jgi:hypothetical protein
VEERGRRREMAAVVVALNVPGEGPANMEGQGTHKLRESAGMQMQYLIGPGMGQKGVIDGGTARVLTGGDGGAAFCRLGCWRVAGK